MKNMPDTFSIDYAFLQKSPVIKKKRLRCWYNVLRERELQRCYYSPSIFLAPPPPPPRAIILDAHPLSTFENQDTCDGKTRYI